MAIKLINQEYCAFMDDYRREYVCDTDADFSDLPQCCTGSCAMSVESGAVRMVNASGKWVPFGG